MEQTVSPIISPQELVSLRSASAIVIVDVRTGPGVKARYAAGHLEGALFVDLDTELADIKPDASNGGRHPLPDPLQFSKVLTQLGIQPASHVIVYDDKNAANAAARFWWMLKAAGHKKIQVIDGGMDAAVNAGFPVSSATEHALITEPYGNISWTLPLADLQETEAATRDDNYLIIDVRDEYRYKGESEPIDLIAGHIPGAVNIPFTGNLDSNGFFLSPGILKHKYDEALQNKTPGKVIVHCGSGVTACHTLLAMDYAGLEIPKLYVGSWSEWSRNNKPIAAISR